MFKITITIKWDNICQIYEGRLAYIKDSKYSLLMLPLFSQTNHASNV